MPYLTIAQAIGMMQCVRMAAGNALLPHISLRLCISHVCSGTTTIMVVQSLADTD